MRWKDRRCVSQSCRFCDSCLCFFFYFRFCVSAIHFSSHFSSHIQQSCLAQHNRSTQQVSVFCCLIQYYTLVYLKYFMTVQIRNHYVPLIFSSETILIITRRKMNVLCPTLRYYAHLPDTCNYVKKSSSFMNNWKKSTTSKITTIGVLTSPKAAFYFACF